MTDWIDYAINHVKNTRERGRLNSQALQRQAGPLWERFYKASFDAIKKFNAASEAIIDFVPSDPEPGFMLEVRGTNKAAKVWLDFDKAFIAYSYNNVSGAKPDRFYLEANEDGSVLLICLGVPCDESLEVAGAVERALKPLLYAAV